MNKKKKKKKHDYRLFDPICGILGQIMESP